MGRNKTQYIEIKNNFPYWKINSLGTEWQCKSTCYILGSVW